MRITSDVGLLSDMARLTQDFILGIRRTLYVYVLENHSRADRFELSMYCEATLKGRLQSQDGGALALRFTCTWVFFLRDGVRRTILPPSHEYSC